MGIFGNRGDFIRSFPAKKRLQIGWGETPRTISVPSNTTVIYPPEKSSQGINLERIERAIQTPFGSKSLDDLLAECRTVCVLWPDESRRELKSVFWTFLAKKLASHDVSHGIAAGKHVYRPVSDGTWRHDALSEELIHCGYTQQGTPVSYPSIVLQSDLIISVGEIRPHYFAGYAGGAKTVFPGVAGAEGIWKNHDLKALPGARLGQIDQNPCRQDMEEAARMAGPGFIMNIIRDHDDVPVEIVCGDPREAHRAGVELARPYFEQSVFRRFDTVLVSDRHPVSKSLYQACKMLPVAGKILNPGGHIILCADCIDGVEPIEVVNEAIYRLGCLPSLPKEHTIHLVSSLSHEIVAPTFAQHVSDLDSALEKIDGTKLAVLPYAANVVPHVREGVHP